MPHPTDDALQSPPVTFRPCRVLEQWDFSTSEDAAFKKSLHPFEVAAIANLMTTSSDRDEACKWVVG